MKTNREGAKMRFLSDEFLEIVPEKYEIEEELTSAISGIKAALNTWKRLLTNEEIQIQMDREICKAIRKIIREYLFIGIDENRVGVFSVDIMDGEKDFATKVFGLEEELFACIGEETSPVILDKWAVFFDRLAKKIRELKPQRRR